MLLISLLTVLCFHLFLLRINSFPSNVLFSRRYLWRRYENHRLFAGKKKPSTFTTHKNKKTFFSKKSFQKLQDLPPALRNKLSKPKQEEIAIKNKQELKNLEKQGTPFKPENKDKRQPVDLELEEATEKREESGGDEENQEEQEGGGEEGPSVKEFLKSATNEEKETFRHALLNKFTEWKVLSQNGFLEKISNRGKLYQEDIERFDREKKKALKLHLTDSNTDEDNNEEEEEEEAEEDHHEEDYEGEEEEENEEESIGSTEGENPNDQPGGGDLLDALLNYAVHSLSPPIDTTSSLINNVADEEENPDQNQLIKKFQSLKKDVAKDRVESNLISKKKKKDAEQRERERERETAFKQQLNNNIHELSPQQIAFVTQNDEYILNKFTGASSAFPLSTSTTTSTISTAKEKKETKPTIKKNEVFYYNLLLEIKDKRLVISFPTIQKVLLGLVRLKEKDIQSTTKYTRFLYQAIQLYQQLRQQRLIAYPVETAVIDNGNSNTKKGDQTMPRFIFPEERQHQQQGEQKKKKSRNYEEGEESFHYSFLRAVYLFNRYNQTINEEIVSLLFPSLNPTTTSNSSTVPIISSDYRHLHVDLAKAVGRFQHFASSSASSSKDQLQQEISEFLHHQVYSYLPIYSIEEMNDLLRVIGKLGFHFEIFQLFEKLKSIQHFSQYASYYQQSSQQYQIILEKMAKENHWDSSILSSLSSSPSSANTVESIWRKLKINAETIEYFISSFLLQMMKEEKCLTMKDLPNFRKQESEVIVLGRSNVGKSSLINALLNRKNLAKVSAIPGHTQAFHFYTLQRRLGWNESSPTSNHEKDPQTIPPTGRTTATASSSPSSSSVFRLVDVPGLGYADTVDEEIQLQWKELIIRYLTKRNHCKLVFHLVDSRHLLTKVDQEIIRIAAKASKQRLKEGKSSYQFVIVLTKVDKYKFNPFSAPAKRSTVPRDGGGTSIIRENPVNEDIIQQIQQEIEDLWSETISSTKQKSQIRNVEDEEMSHTDKLFDQIIQEEDDGKTELSHRDHHSNNQLKQMEVKVIQTSSLQKTGLDSLWKQILAIC